MELYGDGVDEVVYEGVCIHLLHPGRVRAYCVGDHPQRPIRDLVSELRDREASDVSCDTHPKKGLVAEPEAVSWAASRAECRCGDVAGTVVVCDPAK